MCHRFMFAFLALNLFPQFLCAHTVWQVTWALDHVKAQEKKEKKGT